MEYQLSYKDKEDLILELKSYVRKEHCSDEVLHEKITKWKEDINPLYGFEAILIKEVQRLSKYLSSDDLDHNMKKMVRGSLSYILDINKKRKLPDDLKLLNETFVCCFTVNEILKAFGQSIDYDIPRLTKHEEGDARQLFQKMSTTSICSDEELIEKVKCVLSKLIDYNSLGLMLRLKSNIEFLIGIVTNQQKDNETLDYTRGALNYFIKEFDVINDTLGIIGYIDDFYITEIAIEITGEDRTEFNDALNNILNKYPFINNIIMDDGTHVCKLSEFMLVNFAIYDVMFKNNEIFNTVVLIEPFHGFTHFLVGFIASLCLINSTNRSKISIDFFKKGQKVIVDNDSSVVAEYTGITEIKNQSFFGLKQEKQVKGIKGDQIIYLPVSHMHRLTLVDSSRIPKGRIIPDLSKSSKPVSPYTYIFQEQINPGSITMDKYIIIVMQISDAWFLSNEISIYGHPLKEVIPVGHLNNKGTLTTWSRSFGTTQPIIVFISDIDVACSFLNENIEKCHSIIIDAANRNRSKISSLKQIVQKNVNTLIFSTSRNVEELDIIKDDRIDIWEWTKDSLSALLWSSCKSPEIEESSSIFSRNENTIYKSMKCIPVIKNISFPFSEDIFDAVRSINYLAKSADNKIEALNEAAKRTFSLMNRLLKCTFPLGKSPALLERINNKIRDIKDISEKSIYLSEDARNNIKKAMIMLEEITNIFTTKNPKAEVMEEILSKNKNLSFVCPDKEIASSVKEIYKKRLYVISSFDENENFPEGVIIPGWFRKEIMRKMLFPSIADPLFLLLYDSENNWYKNFSDILQNEQRKRIAMSNKSSLFSGFKTRKSLPEKDKTDIINSFMEIDEIQKIIDKIDEIDISEGETGTSERIPATLILFEEGYKGFFTDSFRANTVTHLLDVIPEYFDESDEIRTKRISDLRPGDTLLFHAGSDWDVIKITADKLLGAGVRDMSYLWRKAIFSYLESGKLTYNDLWEKLKQKGCLLQESTIRLWTEDDYFMISPQDYEKYVPMIAEVTDNKLLKNNITEVISAIYIVRGAHIKASHQLAKEVKELVVRKLKEGDRDASNFNIRSDVIMTRILLIDDKKTMIKKNNVNRLYNTDI
ncbi:MAG: DrmE family protein [Candidatus Coatesbacteria bacterium]|nr:DrmE family protein [Candidatus Coatesbacteria bacterium]